MSDALSIIYYIFNKFIDLIFNKFEIFTDVTLGWIMVAVIIISIMITNILNLAKAYHRYDNSTTIEHGIRYNENGVVSSIYERVRK